MPKVQLDNAQDFMSPFKYICYYNSKIEQDNKLMLIIVMNMKVVAKLFDFTENINHNLTVVSILSLSVL